MKVTSMEEYGLRCMLQLALADGDAPVSVASVAANEGLSSEYAGKLLHMLRRAGLVESVRGRNGGFVLASPPEEINVDSIMRVFSPDLFDLEYCNRFTGAEEICVHNSECSLRPVWWTISELVKRTLEKISLMDLMCGEASIQKELESQLGAVGVSARVAQKVFRISEGA